MIDCSGSAEVAERYEGWLAAGIHVVTPNKQAGAGPLPRYQRIRAAAAASGARFRYEATVGAGLPVITTLRDLVDTGDEVLAIEGIFSGTLAWLFNRFDGSQPFSSLVAQARSMGYTEPDPRDDLSGVDVARKLVILAREAGHALSLEQVQVESLVPALLREGSVDDFMARLGESDASLLQRLQDARARGAVLRYVAQLGAGGASVGLQELPADHAFANLRLTDNVVQFRTRRYCDNPLVVQGPGPVRKSQRPVCSPTCCGWPPAKERACDRTCVRACLGGQRGGGFRHSWSCHRRCWRYRERAPHR